MKSFGDLEQNDGNVGGSRQGGSPSRDAPVDVEALAERVYRLLLEDMRLDRARGAVDRRPREW